MTNTRIIGYIVCVLLTTLTYVDTIVALESDINNDLRVNLGDYALIAHHWNSETYPDLVDINKDGYLNQVDIDILASQWLALEGDLSYVDGDNGSDVNDGGSAKHPWKTIQYAIDQLATDNDNTSHTIYVMPSSSPYTEPLHGRLQLSYSQDQTSHDGHTFIIQGEGIREHIIIAGNQGAINVTPDVSDQASEDTHFIFRNLTFYSGWNTDAIVAHEGRKYDLTFEECLFYVPQYNDSGISCIEYVWAGQGYLSRSLSIRNCDFYPSSTVPGSAILINSANTIQARYNIFNQGGSHTFNIQGTINEVDIYQNNVIAFPAILNIEQAADFLRAEYLVNCSSMMVKENIGQNLRGGVLVRYSVNTLNISDNDFEISHPVNATFGIIVGTNEAEDGFTIYDEPDSTIIKTNAFLRYEYSSGDQIGIIKADIAAQPQLYTVKEKISSSIIRAVGNAAEDTGTRYDARVELFPAKGFGSVIISRNRVVIEHNNCHGLMAGVGVDSGIVEHNYLQGGNFQMVIKGDGNIVRHNICKGPKPLVLARGANNIITNNTFYGTNGFVFNWNDNQDSVDPINNILWNNIFYAAAPDNPVILAPLSYGYGMYCDYNMYYHETGGPIFRSGEDFYYDLVSMQQAWLEYPDITYDNDMHSTWADPEFTNPQYGNFTPQNPITTESGSPDISGQQTYVGAIDPR